jgi:DNA-binding NtrC family response regulator
MTKVLLVEPEQPLMRVMGWVLAEAGFEVIGLKDPGEAAEMLPEIRPDVTVLNGEYAEEERRRWIDKLHERWPGARVIDVHRMQVWGESSEHADATLIRPFHADTLVEAIHDLAGHDGHTAPASPPDP